MFVLFLELGLEYTGLVMNSGPVPFVPWGTARESREEVKTIHNEKAPTFHETLEAGVKDAGIFNTYVDALLTTFYGNI